MTRARLLGHHDGTSAWQLAVRPPCPALARVVVGDYVGYDESSPTPVRRRHFASPGAVLIIELGPPLRLRGDADPHPRCHPAGFLAPPAGFASVTEHDGRSRGIEVKLGPLGAHLLLLNAPMTALAGQALGLDELLGAPHRLLLERLHEAADWDTRFDLLDDALTRRLTDARAPSPEVRHALARITASAGDIDIAALAAELGQSQKSLIQHFNRQVGLPPKRVARLVRFEHVIRHLRGDSGERGWAELAATFGYYDQSHLVRDFRQFTGVTPTAARASLAPWPV